MTTLNSLGFSLDSDEMKYIVGAIRDVDSTSVEQMAETLTDRPKPATFTDEEIQWMKTTPVSKITIGDNYQKGELTFFDLKTENVSKLQLSARPPTNGELRGDIVRKIIEDVPSGSQQTVYDALQSHLRNVCKNTMFIYATNGTITKHLSLCGFDPKSSVFKNIQDALRTRINIFGQSVYKSLKNLDLPEENYDSLTEKTLEQLNSQFNKTFKAHPIPQELISFMDTFRNFENQLITIDKKAKTFDQKSGFGIAASELYDSLSEARDKLLVGEFSIDEFKSSCQTACKKAVASGLKDHRDWGQVFYQVLAAVTSIATLGVANIISKMITGSFDFSKKDNNTIQQVKEINATLGNLSSDFESIKADPKYQNTQDTEDAENQPKPKF
jgi:hypothetical protein